jgi:NADPH2:quinone reductase
MEATGGHGADVAVNLVGGTQFAECVRCLARKGRLCVVGYVDGSLRAEIDLGAVHAKRLQVYGISNAQLPASEKAAAAAGFARDVLPAFVDGRLDPVVDRVFGFDAIPAAKACMDSSAMVGKIVVTLEG